MGKKTIFPASYPAWVKKMNLPLSPAVESGPFIFLSGYPGCKDRLTGETLPGIEAQTRQTLDVIRDILEACDSSLDQVVKVNVFLRNSTDFAVMNKVYQTYFNQNPPVRTTIVSELVDPEALIEIECTAMR